MFHYNRVSHPYLIVITTDPVIRQFTNFLNNYAESNKIINDIKKWKKIFKLNIVEYCENHSIDLEKISFYDYNNFYYQVKIEFGIIDVKQRFIKKGYRIHFYVKKEIENDSE